MKDKTVLLPIGEPRSGSQLIQAIINSLHHVIEPDLLKIAEAVLGGTFEPVQGENSLLRYQQYGHCSAHNEEGN